ncbi:MAG: hypothetical protein KJ643_15255 [Gammaproteobacteria bacterium]|uniref:hypothetical protein n=1 Tax=Pseudomonas mandelii TaxID=75612 RepID=UPI0012B3E012|nr:hypothetical protein [Pseudomonas mandelii]MBU0523590.1 hypothetical protein [Gammaproteobacteria bacterium]MBU0844626.1 hypothetical protein [Gammaproteobacteria bacterium]MBU1843679.1 hypothetical protein [Gammaproteobacteria bacterium]MSU92841.1 hypothetical protein [Pseudomonas mandelii]
MQASDARRNARLKTVKKVFWWVLGTMVAVPITKWVETQLNLSFISPAIAGLWNWISALQEWFMQDASLPIWALSLLLLITGLLLIPLLILIYARYEADTNEVDPHPLNNDQVQVFLCIGRSVNSGNNITLSGLVELTHLSRIATHSALDVLTTYQLITGASDNMGYEYIDLTRRGREFYMELQRDTALAGA